MKTEEHWKKILLVCVITFWLVSVLTFRTVHWNCAIQLILSMKIFDFASWMGWEWFIFCILNRKWNEPGLFFLFCTSGKSWYLPVESAFVLVIKACSAVALWPWGCAVCSAGVEQGLGWERQFGIWGTTVSSIAAIIPLTRGNVDWTTELWSCLTAGEEKEFAWGFPKGDMLG